MRFACIVLCIHLLTSLILLLWVALEWLERRERISDNGWTLKDCTPLAEIEIPLYFIPVVNVLVTYFALRFIAELATHINIGQVVNVYLWKFGLHYQEIN